MLFKSNVDNNKKLTQKLIGENKKFKIYKVDFNLI